jgi:hypothetical protein
MSRLFRNLFSSPRQVLPFFVGTHLSLSVLSIVNSLYLPPMYDNLEEVEECFDAGHYNSVQYFISRMYQGDVELLAYMEDGISVGSVAGNDYMKDTTPSADQGVRLASTATFEDPAAVCRGLHEIREAFQALKSLHSMSLSPPKCINVEPQGGTILLTYALHQQYTLPWYGSMALRSIVQVTVQLHNIEELVESELRILNLQELWGSKPLAWPYLLYFPSRRLNGMLSYQLTSMILKQ